EAPLRAHEPDADPLALGAAAAAVDGARGARPRAGRGGADRRQPLPARHHRLDRHLPPHAPPRRRGRLRPPPPRAHAPPPAPAPYPPPPDDPLLTPGGLAGVWAEENSRDAIFEAMRRREVFGTSGPRIAVRFFAGFDLPADLCDSPGLVATGYARGVPMGGDLRTARGAGAGSAPAFAVHALRDPGTADHGSTRLQRIQIVKLWEEGGRARQEIVDVAGDPANGAGVDLATCEPTGPGFDALCAVWRDPG